jgi:glycosyltransferase involved in cell wall biosynthesis
MSGEPAVSAVVASHGRALRLRWLLNALEEQTLREPWELVVVHDYDEPTAARALGSHPLARDGMLRAIPIAPGTGSPARQRNLGWRAARAPLVAFTDDDCRPEPDWLERLLAAAGAQPERVVQGRVRPDPLETAILAAPHVRTLWIDPVGPYVQTANVLYPRALLERLGGFDERAIAGEDVELSLRARALGVAIAGAPEAIVNHAVESHPLPGIVRQNWKWRHLAYLVKCHPEFRREMPMRIFWDEEHLRTTAAMVGLLGARRRPVLLVLAVPYARRALARRGPQPRRRALALAELPGQLTRQAAEVAGMAAGSARYRTFVL